jgi:hypothetical protein
MAPTVWEQTCAAAEVSIDDEVRRLERQIAAAASSGDPFDAFTLDDIRSLIRSTAVMANVYALAVTSKQGGAATVLGIAIDAIKETAKSLAEAKGLLAETPATYAEPPRLDQGRRGSGATRCNRRVPPKPTKRNTHRRRTSSSASGCG